MTGARRHRRRVVMFPFPFRSHIAPMLQLAELLRGRGLAVTVVFDEMALGLAGSGVPFLWVIRPGFVTGIVSDALPLPEPLTAVVDNGMGKVTSWRLAHPAIGGFWTHCGWNSTLESICEGVPMLAQPCFGDQTVNARYVTHQWGVGLELGEVFDRDRVAEAVRKLMVGEEGAAMRDKARGLKAKASKSVEDDGASNAAIDRLVRYIGVILNSKNLMLGL
uniref:UDP-glycosyltransferases domain-containing protein n=1 Tax=Oryza barthii TaxID=65489 RepID=A0A0D3GP29_9ORYZ